MSGSSQLLIACIIAAGCTLPIFIPVCGRWLTARLCGMSTPILSFGVGTTKWTRVLGKFWNTEFRLAPLLFVGYVSIPGLYYMPDKARENAPAAGTEKEAELRLYPLWKKLLVTTSAVLSCLLCAWMFLFIAYSGYGAPGFKNTTGQGTTIERSFQPLSVTQSATLASRSGKDQISTVVRTFAEVFDLLQAENQKQKLEVPYGIAAFADHEGMQVNPNGFDVLWVVAVMLVVGAFLNSLPLVGLDGGYFLLLIWQGLTGRALTSRVISVHAHISTLILVCLMLWKVYYAFNHPVIL